ncbi:hypothetical protein H6B11_05975 [Mediterraneibacter glycyrrhizinilyticus]|nr:hypothetical protein [Mediterraneibacter glycyrrhizinilyticus]MBM6853703.1 hypothetical protein [Mediterraneibacter glycyrrhizinilyticus]
MSGKEQELIDRYIYQVVRRLPRDQRGEVSLELQELIGDMLEAGGSAEDVLSKLGDPAKFAEKYQDRSHCLIGPEYYDNYVWLLRIVLTCVTATVFVVSVIQGIRDGIVLADGETAGAAIMAAGTGIANGFTGIFIAGLSAFGGVTLAFAVMERRKIRFEMKKEKNWTVSDLGDNFTGKQKVWTPGNLSPIPHKKAMISRGDSIVGIVFIMIFGVLLIFAPQFFGAVFPDGEVVRTIPVFNLDQWDIILPLFILSLAIGLADEVLHLVVGHYCRLVMISSIVTGGLQMILLFLLLKAFPLWNPGFATELELYLGGQDGTGLNEIVMRWNGDFVSNCFLAFGLMITLLEVGSTVYRTLRYGIEDPA